MMNKNMLGELTPVKDKENIASTTNDLVLSVADAMDVKDYEAIHDIGKTILPILCNTMVHENNLAGLKLLQKDGANLNAVDNLGFAPLHIVCSTTGDMKIAEFLVDEEINIDALDFKARSPLFLAIKKGFIELSNLLVSHGATVIAPQAMIAEALNTYG
jgi:hypothetical protein